MVRSSLINGYPLSFSKVGGRRMLTLSLISGSMTFPAYLIEGKPVSPVTVRVGFQPLLIKVSRGFNDTVYRPCTVLR